MLLAPERETTSLETIQFGEYDFEKDLHQAEAAIIISDPVLWKKSYELGKNYKNPDLNSIPKFDNLPLDNNGEHKPRAINKILENISISVPLHNINKFILVKRNDETDQQQINFLKFIKIAIKGKYPDIVFEEIEVTTETDEKINEVDAGHLSCIDMRCNKIAVTNSEKIKSHYQLENISHVFYPGSGLALIDEATKDMFWDYIDKNFVQKGAKKLFIEFHDDCGAYKHLDPDCSPKELYFKQQKHLEIIKNEAKDRYGDQLEIIGLHFKVSPDGKKSTYELM
ncbi:hypothetical protein KJ855_01455 [Patescibacteria group bacterium]|nr:hypothetical protein [Patescibacteria group bacterium]